MVKVLFWIIQGALDPNFFRYLMLIVRQQHLDLIGLFEPRVSGDMADDLIRRTRFDYSYQVEANGFSGGLCIFWKETMKFDVMAVSNQFVHGIVSPDSGAPRFFVTFTYGSLNATICKSLWCQLVALESDVGWSWVVGGDLNVIGNLSERQRGSARRTWGCELFGNFMDESGLLDMGFSGPQFTWK
ncbi:hypothetical protein HRI_003868400 [Hibiscus trionum]|uniref:Endonuclease/exonuclease/phosphatase domain-containing protein n=1 Tax=Hibiscus trionum TaxID=183268 RepID=A0A9W7MIP1_HIBTR|nr:hypothetical protein HRI_003868400 [Hibiscus trionum]